MDSRSREMCSPIRRFRRSAKAARYFCRPGPYLRTLAGALCLAAAVQALAGTPATKPGQTTSDPLLQPRAPLFADLGDHHHPISTKSAKAQSYFNQGLTLAFAFNHAEAERSFREAARMDPDCPMAWWGVALVLGPNINKPMAPEDAPRAWEALQKARACADKGTERERAYIDALAERYAETAPQDRSALDKAYAEAMREVASRYPDDMDAATLFAEAMMDTMPWQYWTNDRRPKAETGEILSALEGVLKKAPNHAGACHLYIHAVEAVTPEKALAAADRLRNLVPGSGHLVHMPAHIYLRLGLYREAMLLNELAAKADESYISQCRAQGFYPAAYYPHNVHFIWYCNTMEGNSALSLAAATKIAAHGQHAPLVDAARFDPLVPMTHVRFGQWDAVLQQPTPPADKPYELAISHYTRGLALAGKGQIEESARELTALQAIAADEKTKALDTPVFPGASLIHIAVQDLAGHVALRKGEHEKAVAALKKAVELEDQLPYMEPPFSYIPMRHGLGAAMIAAGKPADAEAVYRQDLKNNPHNGWSLYGLAQSLRAQGKPEQADEVMQRFELAWMRSDIKLTSSRF